jgi:lysophospholipase L1-like esterase
MFVIGDSITAGHNSYVIGNHWWEDVARQYGYTPTLGAKTGSGMSYYNGTNACKIVHTADLTGYNVIVVAFGTNDYGNNQPIGTIDDSYIYSLDSSQTFYAATKYVIEEIKRKNPTATIVFSLPINRTDHGTLAGKWAYGAANTAGHTLNDYCNAIIDVCNKYCVPYIDHRNSAFDVYAVQTLLYDHLHPTVEGYKILGCEMSAKIGNVIRPFLEYDGSGGIDVEGL